MAFTIITRHEAEKLVGLTDGSALSRDALKETISAARRLHRFEPTLEELGNLRIFQWKGWTLFRKMHDDKIKNAAPGELIPGFTTLLETARYYNDLKDIVRDPKIEAIRESILKGGYTGTGAFLVASDVNSPARSYVRDAHHRLIAYLSLIVSGECEYLPLVGVVAEEPGIIRFLGSAECIFSEVRRP